MNVLANHASMNFLAKAFSTNQKTAESIKNHYNIIKNYYKMNSYGFLRKVFVSKEVVR